MKLEDVKRIVLEAGQRLTGKAPPTDVTPDSFWSTLTPTEQDVVRAIAELCEQHGVERAKAKAPERKCGSCDGEGKRYAHPSKGGGMRPCPDCNGTGVDPYAWELLDEEILTENAHGKTKTD